MRLATLLLLLPLSAAAQAAPDAPALPSVSLPSALDRVLRDYESAWRARDHARLAGLFALDGFVLPSGHPPVRGRDAIAAHYEGKGGDLHLRALAFDTTGALGYIIGAYGYGATAPVPDMGKYILLLRRGPDGRWLIAADMDNGNRRPRGPG